MIYINYDFNRSSNSSNCPRLTFENKNALNLTFSISSTLYNVKIVNDTYLFSTYNYTILTTIDNTIIITLTHFFH